MLETVLIFIGGLSPVIIVCVCGILGYFGYFDRKRNALEEMVKTYKPSEHLPSLSFSNRNEGCTEPAKGSHQNESGYNKTSGKFYIFRKGQSLPDHLMVVECPNILIGSRNRLISEAKQQLRIDVQNHGFNAVTDAVIGSFKNGARENFSTIVGRPTLVVSRNYKGNIEALASKCNINFFDLIYCRARVCKDANEVLTIGEKQSFWYFGSCFR